MKRTFDILLSFIGLIILSWWLFPILGIIIWVDSNGPIMFKQKRTGLKGKSFTCFKFRTMYDNGDKSTKQASRNDVRVTNVGAVLRKFSLDELPQLYNVLIGDMSLIGPRPHMIEHTEYYSTKIKNFKLRENVRPGITGLAQLKGFRGETETIDLMQQRIEQDLQYIESMSIKTDIKILYHTLRKLFSGDEKAY